MKLCPGRVRRREAPSRAPEPFAASYCSLPQLILLTTRRNNTSRCAPPQIRNSIFIWSITSRVTEAIWRFQITVGYWAYLCTGGGRRPIKLCSATIVAGERDAARPGGCERDARPILLIVRISRDTAAPDAESNPRVTASPHARVYRPAINIITWYMHNTNKFLCRNSTDVYPDITVNTDNSSTIIFQILSAFVAWNIWFTFCQIVSTGV